jgi:ketosteroid isomerase-like protein
MSQEGADAVRNLFETFVAEGFDAGAERFLEADAEYVEAALWPGASTYRGRQEIVACFKGYAEAMGGEGNWGLAVERVADGGDQHAALVRLSGRGSASGAPHEHLWGYVARVTDGRVAHLQAFYDPAEALGAIGIDDE